VFVGIFASLFSFEFDQDQSNMIQSSGCASNRIKPHPHSPDVVCVREEKLQVREGHCCGKKDSKKDKRSSLGSASGQSSTSWYFVVVCAGLSERSGRAVE